MRKGIVFLTAVLLLASAGSPAAQLAPDEREALRTQLEQRFDVVPLSGAVGLRPKERMGDVRFIEVGDTISINGVAVTGREVRERVGADAEAILRLSYLDAESRRQVAEPSPAGEAGASEADRTPAVETPGEVAPADRGPRRERSSGDRVRIFGDVHVAEDVALRGQVVAVLGSVRVDGEVDDQVVAVLGSVYLGPRAVVRGDIVTVGGRVERAPGAQVRGAVTEVALGALGPRLGGPVATAVPSWFGFWDGFGAVPRLLRSTFRVLLLALVAALTLLLARSAVEAAAERLREAPLHATLVGMVSVLLLGPVLLLVSIILIVSIVGLPLLLAIPFLLCALFLMALAGFSGAALAVGQWVCRRLNVAGTSPFVAVALGVVILLLPLLLGRVVGLAGWWGSPLAILLVAVATGVEFVAWSAGFGAVLANGYGRWQARRVARSVPPPPPPVAPAAVPPEVGA